MENLIKKFDIRISSVPEEDNSQRKEHPEIPKDIFFLKGDLEPSKNDLNIESPIRTSSLETKPQSRLEFVFEKEREERETFEREREKERERQREIEEELEAVLREKEKERELELELEKEREREREREIELEKEREKEYQRAREIELERERERERERQIEREREIREIELEKEREREIEERLRAQDLTDTNSSNTLENLLDGIDLDTSGRKNNSSNTAEPSQGNNLNLNDNNMWYNYQNNKKEVSWAPEPKVAEKPQPKVAVFNQEEEEEFQQLSVMGLDDRTKIRPLLLKYKHLPKEARLNRIADDLFQE
jgi:hypothetical protein